MSFFDDFANAVTNYPTVDVNLNIVNVSIQTGTPGPINVDEVCKFKVKVNNTGHLDMTQVSLKITGENGATVSTNANGPWYPSVISGSLTVNAGGGSQDSAFIYFKAPSTERPDNTVLIKASINGWNAGLNHILNGHSESSNTPTATHSAKVHP